MAEAAEQPDDVLVRRAQEGDTQAFETLVRYHSPQVYRVALRLLGHEQDAQDVTQDAFVKAWLNLGRFRADSKFSTWMYRIVTNGCLNMLRGGQRSEPLPDTLPGSRPEPHRVVEANSQFESLKREILKLTPEQRVPLVLRELGDCSYEEIGDILGLTVPAVRGRLHRARAQLVMAMRGWT